MLVSRLAMIDVRQDAAVTDVGHACKWPDAEERSDIVQLQVAVGAGSTLLLVSQRLKLSVLLHLAVRREIALRRFELARN
jgi:hypothetical protein